MNKYQEAINYIVDNFIDNIEVKNGKPMNKETECVLILQELVDKEESVDKEKPMKVEYFYGVMSLEPYNARCPNCNYILGKDFIPTNVIERQYHGYCFRCGQRLDWSE